MTVDVWMQHPTLRFLSHDMFASLRRWTGQDIPAREIPSTRRSPRWTRRVFTSGCSAPGTLRAKGALIANDEEAKKLYLAENAARVFRLGHHHQDRTESS